MKKSLAVLLLAAGLLNLGGCSSMNLAMTKSDLRAQTRMSESVFLDPVAPQDQVVLVQIRNASDQPDFTFQQDVEAALTAKGWRITRNPDEARFMLQALVLGIGRIDATAGQTLLSRGYGAPVDSVLLGGGAAYAMGGNGNTIAGVGIAAGLVDVMAGQVVRDIYYTVVTDVQISERSRSAVRVQGQQYLQQGGGGTESLNYAETSNWKRYRVRVLSTANKVNLGWPEAQPLLVKGLTNSLSGVF